MSAGQILSSRLPSHAATNALARAVEALRAQGIPYIDLTESNPTRVGLPYPADLLEPLSDARALVYDPHPFGLRDAREAVAADCARRGASVGADRVVLSSSTSEAYSWLFKLLCDPDAGVLVPRPSYPLFDHLTRLEAVRAVPYDLDYHGTWEIDFSGIDAAPPETRALLVVSPNNPTGSYLSAGELDRLVGTCRDRGWALIVDEVFADYRLEADSPVTDIAARAEVLSFTLGGASKTLGLPQIKLGWTIVGGPEAACAAALSGLEIVADTFLSVGTPVQIATARLLQAGAPVRHAIERRLRANLAALRRLARDHPACDVLRVDGGWSACVRVPSVRSEERLVLDLLAQEHVLVHPGYFFEFRHEAFLVLSLLVSEPEFADASARVLRFASEPPLDLHS